MEKIPKVGVLLATHNGLEWLPELVQSILKQEQVNVKIIASDDASEDGTTEWLRSFSQNNSNLCLLPKIDGLGSSGKNFYRLILEANTQDCDYIAFSDQDDIWLSNKLYRHIQLLEQHKADGVSSNVVAFWENGTRALINKSFALKRYDFLFESSGPGCTFLVTPWLLHKTREVLKDKKLNATRIELHDWLIYAICRSSGKTWFIDARPSLKYRQHGNNVVGVNLGIDAKIRRFKLIFGGWYRTEVIKICRVCAFLTSDKNLEKVALNLLECRVGWRLRMLTILSQTRRSAKDQLFFALILILYIF